MTRSLGKDLHQMLCAISIPNHTPRVAQTTLMLPGWRAVFFAVDGVDVLGGAGEGEAELVGGAGAGGGDRRDGAAD